MYSCDQCMTDYRWPVIRTWMPRWFWPIFDFVIVALMQNFLLLATAVSRSSCTSYCHDLVLTILSDLMNFAQLPQYLLLSMLTSDF